MIEKIRMAELTSEEARENLTADALVLPPMGSLENQGIHAPTGDYMAADLVAVDIAKAARADGVATFVAPVIPFGGRDYFDSSHGGISLSHTTFSGDWVADSALHRSGCWPLIRRRRSWLRGHLR